MKSIRFFAGSGSILTGWCFRSRGAWALTTMLAASVALMLLTPSPNILGQPPKGAGTQHAKSQKPNQRGSTQTSKTTRAESTTSSGGEFTDAAPVTQTPSTAAPITETTSSDENSVPATQGSDTSGGADDHEVTPKPPSPSLKTASSLISVRNIILLLLLVSILISVVLFAFRRVKFAGQEQPPPRVNQEPRPHPSPPVSQKDLQELSRALDASFKKNLTEFGNLLLAELVRRTRSQDTGKGAAAPAPATSGAASGFPVRTPPSPRKRRNIEQSVREFCAGTIGNSELITAAEELSLRWGSATPMGMQKRVSVKFGSTESRIIAIEKEPAGLDYFLVLKEEAFWSFDLELLFDGKGQGGGRPPDTRNTRTITKTPTIAQLDGGDDELKIVEVGSVEVVEV